MIQITIVISIVMLAGISPLGLDDKGKGKISQREISDIKFEWQTQGEGLASGR